MALCSSRELIESSPAVPTSSTPNKLSARTQSVLTTVSRSFDKNISPRSPVSYSAAGFAFTKTKTTSTSIREKVTVIPTSPTETMRSRKKAVSTPFKQPLAGYSGRITRSKAAVSSTTKLPGQLHPPSTTPDETPSETTASSLSASLEDPSACDVAPPSSRTSDMEVDEPDPASSEYQDEAEQGTSSSNTIEEASADQSSTFSDTPPRKRIKISKQEKLKQLPVNHVEPVPSKVELEVFPCRQVKIEVACAFKKGVDQALPPIHNIVDIFDDITQRAMNLGLEEAIQHLGSRKLKVATMCSGTESPVLALTLVCESKSACRKLEITGDF